jgi:hypothetical protein
LLLAAVWTKSNRSGTWIKKGIDDEKGSGCFLMAHGQFIQLPMAYSTSTESIYIGTFFFPGGCHCGSSTQMLCICAGG